MDHLGGVEEDFGGLLALLASEPHHPEATASGIARTFPGALEIAPAVAPSPADELVDLREATDGDGEVGRRTGATS